MRRFYRRFITLKGEPRTIAAGMALGVCIGVTPTIPFHTVLIVALGLLLRINISAAYLGSWLISNPVTIPFFYILEYQLGNMLWGREPYPLPLEDFTLPALAFWGEGVLLPLLTGGVVLALPFAIAAYLVSRWLLSRPDGRRLRWIR